MPYYTLTSLSEPFYAIESGPIMLLHHHFIGTAKRYRNKLAFVDCSSGKDMRYGKALAGDLEWYKVFYYMRLTVIIFMC